MRVTVEYTDGTIEHFEETSAPGGSYCTRGKSVEGWYVITDAHGKETHIPSERIKKVETYTYR